MEHVIQTHEVAPAVSTEHVADNRSVNSIRPDLDVAADVEQRISRYEQVRQTHPPYEVMVRDGVVTLTGNVRTRIIRRVMSDIAAQVPGVVKVENHIYDDPDLELAVALTLGRIATANETGDGLHASITHGVVTLLGRVVSPEAREEVQQSVSAIPGVRRVLNEITVEGSPGKP